MTTWERLEELLEAGDCQGLVDVVRDLDLASRKALVAPLKEFERSARDQRLWYNSGALSVIGAAVLPSPSTLAPWLVRNGFWSGNSRDVGLVTSTVEVLKARAVPWLPNLVRRLAERLPTRRVDSRLSHLVFELVKLTGIDPPPTDGLVLAWASNWRLGLSGLIDSQWLGLVPRMFEVAGVGREIDSSERFGGGWPAMIAEFVADGRVDRTTVIDAAIGALQRSGKLGDIRGYLKVYRALDPSLPEIVDRVRDYLPLLADAHSTVAGVAQQHLFRADDAGHVDVELMLDAGQAVFHRSEKKLIRAHIDRLKDVITRKPDYTDDVLRTLALLFGHEAADIQANVVELVIAHACEVSQQTRDELAAAASQLPADLRAATAEVLGAVNAPLQSATPLLPVLVVPEFPAPIASLADLVQELNLGILHKEFADSVEGVTDPDVIAGHLLPYLKEKTLRGRGGGRVLTALVHSSGPMRENGARALAHGLDAHDRTDRAEAVDALLVLAARGQWDGSALGRQIGALAADTELSLSRVVPCLRHLAQSGATVHVWDTVAAALPAMLSLDLERPPQRLADLLAFGVELVDHVRPHGVVIPELTAVAARRGSSRIITEAKRLMAALT